MLTARERELELQDALHELAMAVLRYQQSLVELAAGDSLDPVLENRRRMVERAKTALAIATGDRVRSAERDDGDQIARL
jgi:hypothetical protein